MDYLMVNNMNLHLGFVDIDLDLFVSETYIINLLMKF
jgi:hypothetical protein